VISAYSVPGKIKGGRLCVWRTPASDGWLIQIFLKSHEHFAYFFRPAEVGNGIGNGVGILEAKQRREFFLIQFVHANTYVVGQDEFQEGLLLAVEAFTDGHSCPSSALFSCERRERIGDVREHVEEVALLGVDNFLHFRELVVPETFFRKTVQEFFASIGRTPQCA